MLSKESYEGMLINKGAIERELELKIYVDRVR
jgi:hypothetical protein